LIGEVDSRSFSPTLTLKFSHMPIKIDSFNQAVEEVVDSKDEAMDQLFS